MGALDDATLDAIKQALSNLHFGSVEIIVHDSKVVQIERKERVRLNEGRRVRQDEKWDLTIDWIAERQAQ